MGCHALPERLELPTLRLTASRSNQLSYGSFLFFKTGKRSVCVLQRRSNISQLEHKCLVRLAGRAWRRQGEGQHASNKQHGALASSFKRAVDIRHHDSLPEWSKGVDSGSTRASCVGSNPTALSHHRIHCHSAQARCASTKLTQGHA